MSPLFQPPNTQASRMLEFELNIHNNGNLHKFSNFPSNSSICPQANVHLQLENREARVWTASCGMSLCTLRHWTLSDIPSNYRAHSSQHTPVLVSIVLGYATSEICYSVSDPWTEIPAWIVSKGSSTGNMYTLGLCRVALPPDGSVSSLKWDDGINMSVLWEPHTVISEHWKELLKCPKQ